MCGRWNVSNAINITSIAVTIGSHLIFPFTSYSSLLGLGSQSGHLNYFEALHEEICCVVRRWRES